MLKIYDTKLREKVPFESLEHGKIGMYVCGPTVYNYIHIGNARPFITFDVLRRYLELKGYDVSKSAALTAFSDADKVSGYAAEAMQWAVAEGLLQGSNGKLNPQGSATRAQVATILMRFMEKIAK